MASVVSHAVAALSMGTCIYRPGMPKRVWLLGAMCSVVPDLDVIGFRFGVRYGDFWGHRGFTHSLVFAALIAAAAMGVGFRFHAPNTGRFPLFSYFFIAAASHGVLDAMTNGGLGVAFFAPLDNGRYFFPWRPIRVSPIGIGRFFSPRGYLILQSELLWIWLPAIVSAGLMLMLRHLQPKERESFVLTDQN